MGSQGTWRTSAPARAVEKERSSATNVAKKDTNRRNAQNKVTSENTCETLPGLVCVFCAHGGVALVAPLSQANITEMCMNVRCCMTAVRVLAHSGGGCIAVVAHGGLFAFAQATEIRIYGKLLGSIALV